MENDVLSDVSLSLSPSQLVHIMGKNGVGKTTLLKIIAGIIKTDSDSLWVNQQQGSTLINEQLLYVGDKVGGKQNLTVRENLAYDACLFGQEEALRDLSQTLQDWGLQDCAEILFKKLSLGQQRKMALARLSLFKKQVWVLDEPYLGLDAQSCNILTQSINNHVQNQGIVLLCSHQHEIDSALKNRLEIRL